MSHKGIALALALAGSAVLSAQYVAPPATPVPTLTGTLQYGKVTLPLPLSAFLLTRTQGAKADNVCLQFNNFVDNDLFILEMKNAAHNKLAATITLNIAYNGVSVNGTPPPSQTLTFTNPNVVSNLPACCGTGGQSSCSSFNATTAFSQSGTPCSVTQGNY